jgi:hypothetical protein
MPRVALILGIFFATLVVSGADAFAQRTTTARAKKVTEFETASHCDVTGSLDSLAIEVQHNPTASAYILTYAPERAGQRLLALFKDYLVNSRGVDPERIKTIYGGRYSDPHNPKTELWIVPAGARSPKTVKHQTNLDTFKGLFAYWDSEDDFGIDIPDEVEFSIGNTTDASFADILKLQKSAVGYVVAYNGEDASPGAWRRVAEQEVDYLKQFDVDANRLKIMFGGHQKATQVQLWILPADAPPPVADTQELPLSKAVKGLEVYGAYLADKKDQTSFLNRITEVLRRHDSVRALLVVRLEVPAPDDQAESPAVARDVEIPPIVETSTEITTEPVADPPPPDLTKLVERFRLELTNNHKIADDRIIVVFASAREYESDSLELWFVPRGQPLPDLTPKAEDSSDDPPAASATPIAAKRP